MFVTPRKKRPAAESDDEVLTPKKVRSLPLSPPPTRHKSSTRSLPSHLARLLDLHKSIEQALSVALATSSSGFTPSAGKDGTSKTSSSAYMPNVINHLSLANAGHVRRCTLEDLSRLVWLWEWDGESLPDAGASLEAVNDDPFIEVPKDWRRGGCGIVITQTLHSSRAPGKRVPAYGIGIEVKTFGKGMTSIAQWTADARKRRETIANRLDSWVDLHTRQRVKQRQTSRASSPTPSPSPNIPYSALPRLPTTTGSAPTSALARDLLDATARKPARGASIPFPTPSSSRRREVQPESPVKQLLNEPFNRPITPETPRHNPTIPQTPTTSRRAALMERVRLKSASTPSKGSVQITARNSEGEEVKRTIGPEDVKRRLLLGRLGDVADAVWMLFASAPQSPSSNPTPPTRRRRAIPIEEVVRVVIKSARSPISTAEATKSLRLLSSISPDFLKLLVIDGEEWLQMASSSAACPPSPSSKWDNEEEVRKRKTGGGSPRSPVKVKHGAVTLRDIKERIRREMDA